MLRQHIIQRAVPISACAAATILLYVAPASASKREVCTPAYVAYKDALKAEKSGHMREARELLQTCMQATSCGGLVPKCSAKYTELVADMSSVVPVVTDEEGAPRVDVEVKMDGEPLTSHLDGRGLPVEPGVHEFTFSNDAGVFSKQTIMILEGQRNRPISASLSSGKAKATAPASTPAPQAVPEKSASDKSVSDKSGSSKPTSEGAPSGDAAPEEAAHQETPSENAPKGPSKLGPVLLGGFGLAGLAAGGLLTYWGVKDNQSLGQCSPLCSPSSVDHIRTMYLAADISVGVGVAALGVATWLYLRSPSTEQTPAPQAAYVFDVHPTASGAFASVKGAF